MGLTDDGPVTMPRALSELDRALGELSALRRQVERLAAERDDLRAAASYQGRP